VGKCSGLRVVKWLPNFAQKNDWLVLVPAGENVNRFFFGWSMLQPSQRCVEIFNANVPSIKPPQPQQCFNKKTPPFFDVGGVFVVFLFSFLQINDVLFIRLKDVFGNMLFFSQVPKTSK